MAQYTFTVKAYMGNRPSATAPKPVAERKDFYATILCLSEQDASGNSQGTLELKFLRPDATDRLDQYGRVNRAGCNTWDPLTKHGIAYFNAYEFEWQFALLTSGKLIKAQVDDACPAYNRIFFDIALPTPTPSALPDIDVWLNLHPNIRSALKWIELNGTLPDYDAWPTHKKNEFRQAFAKAWNREPLALEDPPPNLVDYGTAGTVFDPVHAWQLFSAYAAQSLAVEIGHRVPWSIASYSDSDLARLFDASRLFALRALAPSGLGYSLLYRVVPASPDYTWSFLRDFDLIGTDRIATIGRVLNWCRNFLGHYSDGPGTANMSAHWGYAGAPPAFRMIEGTIKTGTSPCGVAHYTAGCWGTTGFLQSVLRAVNVPVEEAVCGGHRTPHFTTDDLFLSHGDDPYTLLSKSTPSFAAELLLIDRTTFDDWFGAGVPAATATANVSRRPTMLAVEYLSDMLLHQYYLDKQADVLPHDGQVFETLGAYYRFDELFPDLWTRLEQKLQAFGYAATLFVSWAVKIPPGCRRDPVTRLFSPWITRKKKGEYMYRRR
jgi:hypothetical protein